MPTASVFISYSHKDEVWKDRLLTHLRVFEYEGLLTTWDDRRIGAGADWLDEIEQAMAKARVAILLVSADFLISDFIRRKEIPTLLERRENEGVHVIPVIVRDCAWKAVPWLARLQARPLDGKPLAGGRGARIDKQLAEIALEVWNILRAETTPEATRAAEQSLQTEVQKESQKAPVLPIVPVITSLEPAPLAPDATDVDVATPLVFETDSSPSTDERALEAEDTTETCHLYLVEPELLSPSSANSLSDTVETDIPGIPSLTEASRESTLVQTSETLSAPAAIGLEPADNTVTRAGEPLVPHRLSATRALILIMCLLSMVALLLVFLRWARVDKLKYLGPGVTVSTPESSPPPLGEASDIGSIRLNLAFYEDCWIEVVIDGGNRFRELGAQGEALDLIAKKSIELTLDNVSAIGVEVNDLPLKLQGTEGGVRQEFLIDLGTVRRLRERQLSR